MQSQRQLSYALPFISTALATLRKKRTYLTQDAIPPTSHSPSPHGITRRVLKFQHLLGRRGVVVVVSDRDACAGSKANARRMAWILTLTLLRNVYGNVMEPVILCMLWNNAGCVWVFLDSGDSVKQFATFASKTVAKRVELGQRSSIEHEAFLLHVHVRSNGLAAVAVCDGEYPSRVAFTLLMKVQEDFMGAYDEGTWMRAREEMPLQGLDGMIVKYQDPHEADAIMKIQKDLDDTKIILHKTIDSVLERGVKLDNLVEKSTDLSAQSKMYVAEIGMRGKGLA